MSTIQKLIEIAHEIFEFDIEESTALVGGGSTIKSRDLVEFLLAVEDFATDELNVEFDWMSDSALSSNRSIFRTPKSLAEHLDKLALANT